MLLDISELMAGSLPSQALRFMNYMAFEGFSEFSRQNYFQNSNEILKKIVGYPLFFLLRIDDMIITLIKR